MAGQTVNLPDVQNRVPQIQEPRSSVSPGEVASPYLSLARTMEHAGGELTDVAKIYAKEAGLQSVGRDEQGNVTVERFPIVGDAAIVYQNAVTTAAMADAEAVAKADFVDIREKHKDDPEGFRTAAKAYRTEKVSQYRKVAGAEVGLNLGRLIDNLSIENYRSLRNTKESHDLQRSYNAMGAQIEGTKNELFALAAQGLDETDKGFQERLQKIGVLYGKMVTDPRSNVSPERMDFEIRQLTAELKVAQIGAKLDETIRTKGIEAGYAEAERVRTDETLNLTPAQRVAAYTRLVTQLNQKQTTNTQVDSSVLNEIKAARQVAIEGGTVTPERMATVRKMAEDTNNPLLINEVNNLAVIAPTLQTWRMASPQEIRRNLDAIEAEERKSGSTPVTQTLKKAGEDMITHMNQRLKTDPNGLANSSGSVLVPDIDFAATDLPAQFRGRVSAAETVAAKYNIAPVYLKPAEKAQLINATKQGGDPMIAAASAIVQGAGDRAPRIFKELGGDAPIMAHIGTLATVQGSTNFVKDAADAIRFKQDKEFKAPNWFKNTSDTVSAIWRDQTVATYGNAMIAVPRFSQAAEATAQAAFGLRAIRNDYDPKFVEGSGAGKKAYQRALQEGVGATFDANGVQYGGIVAMSPRNRFFGTDHVLIPTSIRADRFKDVIGQLRDEDIGGKWTALGKNYSIEDVKLATPVAQPGGGYWFAAGDPASTDPQYIPDASGRQPLLININALEPVLRKRTVGAYKGG